MPTKCAMCGKETVISDEYDSNNKTDKEQKQRELKTSNMIVEQIDGRRYTFDTADCALMFKRFNSVYGSSFADE